jgi:multicomponent K+:H+ antiporter subunit D
MILVSSFLMILGFARAGSALFWKPAASETQPAEHAPEGLAFTATIALLVGLAILTILAGPITDWLAGTAAELDRPTGYIEANQLGEER